MKTFLIETYKFKQASCLTLKDGPNIEDLNNCSKPFALYFDFETIFDGKHIVVTSTSWTDDEKIDILYQALVICESTCSKIVMVITGDGKNRSTYSEKFGSCNFKHITIIFAWLPLAEYFGLLSMHYFNERIGAFRIVLPFFDF
jgi:hypothetical protein